MTTTTETLAAHIERCYRTADWDGLRAIYTPDAMLDAHVPMWRFQLQGPDAIVGWFKEETADFADFRVTWARTTPIDGGVILEWEMHEGGPGAERLCREVDLFRGDGERISEHVLFCTGLWDAETIARQKAEAPMVRW